MMLDQRAADGGLIYHVLNRTIARLPMFEKDDDYKAIEQVLVEAVDRTWTRLVNLNPYAALACTSPFDGTRARISRQIQD